MLSARTALVQWGPGAERWAEQPWGQLHVCAGAGSCGHGGRGQHQDWLARSLALRIQPGPALSVRPAGSRAHPACVSRRP